MIKNPYIELLSVTDNHPITAFYNVSPFLNKNISTIELFFGNVGWSNNDILIAQNFLKDMLERGYIQFEKLPAEVFTTEYSNFSNTDFLILFTSKGLDYLQQHRLTQSNLSINKASLKSMLVSAIIGGLTLVVAVSAVYVSYSTLEHSKTINNGNQIFDKRLRELELRLRLQTTSKTPIKSVKPSQQ